MTGYLLFLSGCAAAGIGLFTILATMEVNSFLQEYGAFMRLTEVHGLNRVLDEVKETGGFVPDSRSLFDYVGNTFVPIGTFSRQVKNRYRLLNTLRVMNGIVQQLKKTESPSIQG